MNGEQKIRRYRALFISDIHLGTRACQAQAFVDFLRENDADRIYLVGDIIDFWQLRRGAHWPQDHLAVLQKLMRLVRKGARLTYIPGNHDEMLRAYCGSTFGGIEIARNAMHETTDGRKFLIIHGDEFDVVVRYAKWLAFFGDWAYGVALWLNTHLNRLRREMGLPYWSLSAFLKHKVKQAVNYIGEFEAALAAEARKRGAQGVVCSHIHHAAQREINGMTYINTGDWVESCTAVSESHSGEFRVIRWAGHQWVRRDHRNRGTKEFEAAA